METLTSSGAEVVVLSRSSSKAAEPAEIQSAAGLLGLQVARVEVTSGDVYSKLTNASVRAVLVAHDGLSALDSGRTIAALRRSAGANVPMLVFGVTAGDEAQAAAAWSGGAIQACAAQPAGYRPESLKFAGEYAHTLAGWEIPAVAAPLCKMQHGGAAESVIAARQGDKLSSVLLVVRRDETEIAFVPSMQEFDGSWRGHPGGLSKALSSLAPYLVFLKKAAGEYGWHLDGAYANLTIDDPWLTQPFGHLDYPALLAEMQKHRFHTTVAFIPWNYDRSNPKVAELVRANKAHFSICIHGNNHTHREFGEYGPTPLAGQVADIKQGAARMERFTKLTGIPHDRFMVFPHSVAPEKTLEALAIHGFVGTANSIDVPAGTAYPTDPAFILRPFTSAYGSLLSLARYSAEVGTPAIEIAIHSFLGNPLLFYGHENMFEKGADAFNAIANLVNGMRPETRWTNLGEISRHTYLLRRRDEQTMDVRMFSTEMDLENTAAHEVAFRVVRENGSGPAIRAAEVNGAPAKLERIGNTVELSFTLGAHESAKVRLQCEGAVDPRGEDVRKTSVYAYTLRLASDFRDLYLSRTNLGQLLTKTYYRRGIYSLELAMEKTGRLTAAAAGFLLIALGARRMFRRSAAKAQR